MLSPSILSLLPEREGQDSNELLFSMACYTFCPPKNKGLDNGTYPDIVGEINFVFIREC